MSSASSRRVAVIGAGISGVVSAAHLKREGLDVTVFERSSAAGGVWYDPFPIHTAFPDSGFRLFDKRVSLEPSYPSVLASKGESYAQDLTSRLSPDEVEAVRHAPPG